jgi:DNA repair exonuclease SbcCD ATPase subunit
VPLSVALVFPAFFSRLTFLSVRYLPLVPLAILPLIATITAADATQFVTLVVSVGTALALGYVGIRSIIHKNARERRNDELKDEVERMKVLDAARQETLSGQLEELRKKEEQSAAESRENQEKMRISLHEIRNQLHVRTLENENLRRDLETANRQFLLASRQLADANGRISVLTSTLLQANQQIAELKVNMERYNHESRQRAQAVEQKIDQLRSGSSDDIPVTVP